MAQTREEVEALADEAEIPKKHKDKLLAAFDKKNGPEAPAGHGPARERRQRKSLVS